MEQIKLKFLSREDIEPLLSMERIIEITEDVFTHFGKGEIYSPPKVSLPLQDTKLPGMHWINSMPSFLKYRNIVGLKWINVTSENSKRSLPVTMGIILLNDAVTGIPLGILDGTWITHMRTGASTAIGAKLFGKANSEVITIVGCGAEGRTNLEATAKFFDFKEVRIVDNSKKAQDNFIEDMKKKISTKIVPFDSVKEATKESDIIVLTTSAQIPLMFTEWAKPGDFITTVSGFSDLDHNFINTADKIYMDEKECAIGRARAVSNIEISDGDVFGDICEVMAGKKAKRESDQEIIIYAPAGMGAVDVGIALEALTLATKKGIGQELTLY